MVKYVRTATIGLLAAVAAVAGFGAREAKAQGIIGYNPQSTVSVPSAQQQTQSNALFTYVISTADMDSYVYYFTTSEFRDTSQTAKSVIMRSGTIMGIRLVGDNPPPPSTDPTGYTWAADIRAKTVTEDTLFYDEWTVGQGAGNGMDPEPGPYTVAVMVKKPV